jgi:hypothetical protein
MKKVIVLCLAIFSVGCASTAVMTGSPVSDPSARQTGSRPPEMTVSAARVGEEIYQAFNFREVEQQRKLVLDREVRGRFIVSNVVVPSQTELVEESSGIYCSEQKIYVDPLVGPYRPVCFQDINNDLKFDRFGVRPGLVWLWQSLDAVNATYRVESGKKVVLDDGGYKKELLYQGIDGNTLRITYREYIDNISRPAFSQELTFPIISGKSTIVFRGLTVSVDEISSTSITYKVVSGTL